MKLLLVYPKTDTLGFSKDVAMIEPLALEYLAAGVSQLHEVQILDLRVSDDLNDTILAWKPDVVGITGFTLHVPEMLSLAQQVKAVSRDIKVIVGGHHATFMPETFFVPDVDVIARWQCEGIIEQILNSIHSMNKLALVPGLIFRTGARWAETSAGGVRPPSIFSDLIPAHHLVKRYSSKYHTLQIHCSAMQMTRGCIYRCTFCDAHKFFEGRHQCRSLQTIAKELPNLPATLVMLADDNVGVNTALLKLMLDWLKGSGVKKKYIIQMGASEVLKNRAILDQWFELGLTAALIGLERISDESIHDFGKKTSVSVNDDAINYWHSRRGILIGSFIVLPTDGEEDFKRLEDYIHTRDIDVPFFNILTPFPGTDIWDRYKDKLDRTFSKHDLLHAVIPTTLPEAEFLRYFYHLYTSLNEERLVRKIIGSMGVGTWLLRLPKAHRAFQNLKEEATNAN